MTDVAQERGAHQIFATLVEDQGTGDRSSLRPEGRRLRLLLICLDGGLAWVTWLVALTIVWPGSTTDALKWALPIASLMALFTLLLATNQRLYQARVCAMRTEEMSRLGRVSAVCGLAVFGVGNLMGDYVSPARAALGAVGAFVVLGAGRSGYSGWLRAARARGRFARRVCILGADAEAQDLVHLLKDHPELGYEVVGVIGEPGQWGRFDTDVPALDLRDAPVWAAMKARSSGVIVTTGALRAAGGDKLVGELMDQGLHVQLSSGLNRVGHHRVRMSPLGHHLTFYLEPHRLAPWQSFVKRTLDLVVASVALVPALPVIGIAAVLIKLNDGGPVFYRQERVGRDGQLFRLVKLRTMVPDASKRVVVLSELNERDGPLFKLARDPRVTRVGRFLRATSIDEIPQIINVIRGQMSVVGPRPALPSEVEKFDPDLLERSRVMPGITGLWQLEARDNPSFRAYRRLDLFYIDNWSIGFDLAIMMGTARMLLVRAFKVLAGYLPVRRQNGTLASVAELQQPPAPVAGR